MSKRPFVIGLTGGIGSGKSTVARFFVDLGVTVIDMDHLSRVVTQLNTPALSAIQTHFGKSVIHADGSLNRAALRKKIFGHPNERTWLENLLHPLIWKETKRLIDACNTPYCIVVIPLLIEKNPSPMIKRILVVDASPANQMTRTKQRDAQSPEGVTAILKAQSSREKRLQMADDVILNDGLLDKLQEDVYALHLKYLNLAKSNRDKTYSAK